MNNNAMIVQRFASRLVVVARESGSLSEDPWAIGGRAVRRVALSFPSGGGGGKQRSLARTPDGHGTRDVGPSPQSKKAETLPAAGLESGHESHLCSRVVEIDAHHALLVWGRERCW